MIETGNVTNRKEQSLQQPIMEPRRLFCFFFVFCCCYVDMLCVSPWPQSSFRTLSILLCMLRHRQMMKRRNREPRSLGFKLPGPIDVMRSCACYSSCVRPLCRPKPNFPHHLLYLQYHYYRLGLHIYTALYSLLLISLHILISAMCGCCWAARWW